MGFFDWIVNIFEPQKPDFSPVVPLAKPIFVSADINGNIVEGELYLPSKPNGKGIVYCHGGFANAITPDIGVYVNSGYTTLHLDFEHEGDIAESDPNRDSIEVIDAAILLKNMYNVIDVSLVGISRGGYVALRTFGAAPTKFRKCVNFMGPINMHDPARPYNWNNWIAGSNKNQQDVIDAKKYFDKGLDPVEMAIKGYYNGYGDKIMNIYGSMDTICPYKDMMIPFCNMVNAKKKIITGAAHNAHRTEEGQLTAWSFLRR